MLKTYPDYVGNLERSFSLITIEHWSQLEKWGMQKKTLFEWMCYITEETGELAEAIAEFEYREGKVEDIIKEATQVAALAVKVIEIMRPYLPVVKENYND